jgi:hypothetical protein
MSQAGAARGSPGSGGVYRPDRKFTPVRIHRLQVDNIITESWVSVKWFGRRSVVGGPETTSQIKSQAGINGRLRLSRCARGGPPFIPFGS